MAAGPTREEWKQKVNLLEAELEKNEATVVDKMGDALKVIVEQSNDMIYYYDVPARRFALLNKKAWDFYGMAGREGMAITAADIAQAIHPDDRETVRNTQRESMKSGRSEGEAGYRFLDNLKRWRWLQDRWAIKRDTAGNPVAIVGIVRDETARWEAEEALRKSERFLRLITDNMLDMILFTDGHLRVKYISPSVAQNLGYAPEDLVGKSPMERIHPEDLQDVMANVRKSSETGEPGKVRYRTRCADGKYIWLETLGRLVSDEKGEYTGSVFSSRDITEQKLAEDALRESEERFRALFDRSLDCVYIHDLEGRFLDANPAALSLLGYDREDMLSVSVASMMDQDQIADSLNSLDAMLRTGFQKELVEYRLRRKDGSYVTVEALASVVYHDGKPLAILGVARDITERKRMEEALLASERNFQRLSITDGLTGLYNQRHFYERLNSEIGRANRYGDPLTILLLDVDDFKRYNDTFGHLEGDKVLSGLAEVVRQALRETDSAYRYGGEEFVVILPHTKGMAGATTAERIRSEVEKVSFPPDGGSGRHVTISIGVAEYAPGEEGEEFVKRADRNMYRAKENGKNQCIFTQ